MFYRIVAIATLHSNYSNICKLIHIEEEAEQT